MVFSENFLLANFEIKIILKMFFLIFSNTDLEFDKKKLAKVALNKNIKVFVICVTFLLIIIIFLTRKNQITSLLTKKVKIFAKYADFLAIFLKKKDFGIMQLSCKKVSN